MLLALADEVTPRDWLGGVADFLSDLFTRPPEMEFMSDDEAAHKDYYRRTIDKGNITRQQIEQIFSAVAAEEQAYASKYGEIQGTLDTALGNMDELLSRVEAGG